MNFDSFILDRVEKLSHFVQCIAGINCFAQARMCIHLTIVSTLLSTGFFVLQKYFLDALLYLFIAILLAKIVPPFITYCEKDYRVGLKNHIKMSPVRIFLRELLVITLLTFTAIAVMI